MVGTTHAPDATDALLATVGGLFPEAEVALVERRRPDPTAGAEYVVLPHRRAPRLLLPVRPATATAASVRRFSASASLPDTARRLVTSAALAAGGSVGFRDRVVVHGPRTRLPGGPSRTSCSAPRSPSASASGPPG